MPRSNTIRITVSGADVAGDEKREGEMSSCQNRRKFSSPASLLSPPLPPPAAQAQPRRFSNVGITARKFSQTLGWGGKVGAELTAEIVDQGRALCAQYIRSRLKRTGIFSKKCGLQRLRSAATLPGGFVVRQVLPELISIGAELERLHPKVAMATSIENDLATWIAENGGWPGLCSYCKPPSTEISLSSFVGFLGALVAAAFLIVLILRWFGRFAI
uniref:Uncharacterized protein n=1 Tax=Rhodnius prolixus TaxID=13249 RepID=T1HXK1_RHOPR